MRQLYWVQTAYLVSEPKLSKSQSIAPHARHEKQSVEWDKDGLNYMNLSISRDDLLPCSSDK